MMDTRVLHIDGLGKAFSGQPILKDISFDFPVTSSLAIIGRSGCGKSTLLSIIAGLCRHDMGTFELSPHCRKAFIMQDYGLFPWKTVRDNLTLPLQLEGVDKKTRCAVVDTMMREMKLEGLAQRFPMQLSGGQCQRVAIGRAILSRPDLLLMDEPFAALDALTREQLQNFLLALCQERKMGFILVTHNVAEAVFLGQYIMVLGGRPAKKLLWLENPCFGKADSRNSDLYFSVVRQVHASLEIQQNYESVAL
jgi:NitT/TauT family transport system ATP-binding protein